jgi:hypothetical protein
MQNKILLAASFLMVLLLIACSEKTTEPGVTEPIPLPPFVGDGTAHNPYQIDNLHNLFWLSENESEWDKHFIQTSNINAASTSGWHDGQGWRPIGYWRNTEDNLPFTGTYDGHNYFITNLTIDLENIYLPRDGYGLFGYIADADIRNVRLKDLNITAHIKTAGLAGYSVNSTIANCFVSGNIRGSLEVGGLIGRSMGSEISYCNASVDIYGSWYAGGLVGINGMNSIVENSYTYGAVSGSEIVGGFMGCNDSSLILNSGSYCDVNAMMDVGGLVGINGNNSNIENCYSTGEVEGGTFVGGLVGTNTTNVKILSSYSTSNVQGYNYCGSLVGGNGPTATITDCYTRGDVIGISEYEADEIGGFVGKNRGEISYSYGTGGVYYTNFDDPNAKGFIGFDDQGVYQANFFDSQTSNQSAATGATAKTSSAMKTPSTFTEAGWDFDIIWDIVSVINDGYPYLRWQR